MDFLCTCIQIKSLLEPPVIVKISPNGAIANSSTFFSSFNIFPFCRVNKWLSYFTLQYEPLSTFAYSINSLHRESLLSVPVALLTVPLKGKNNVLQAHHPLHNSLPPLLHSILQGRPPRPFILRCHSNENPTWGMLIFSNYIIFHIKNEFQLLTLQKIFLGFAHISVNFMYWRMLMKQRRSRWRRAVKELGKKSVWWGEHLQLIQITSTPRRRIHEIITYFDLLLVLSYVYITILFMSSICILQF